MIHTILCPVDFSEFSRHALAHAAQLARWFSCDLVVLYVYPSSAAPPRVLYNGMPAPMPVEPLPTAAESPGDTRTAMSHELEAFVGTVNMTGVQMRCRARPGSVVRDILQEAAALHADLIVLGTHGLTGFDRLVLGSVTEKVLRKAECAVMTVPPPVKDPPADPLQLFKRILCPTDFSNTSLKALEYAMSLAREADAELLLLHVIEAEDVGLQEQHALARLRDAVPEDAQAWCHPEALTASGKPYEVILRVAAERDVRLIVMGVHGRNVLDRLFFGSTTSQVVRAARCPVLTQKA